jgi:hypothetical protein
MDNTNEMNDKTQKMITAIRHSVLIANISLSGALDTPFMATYENEDGILVMAMKPDHTAIILATGTDSSIINRLDIIVTDKGVAEKREVYQCETQEDADQIWDLLNDKMYDWSNGEIDNVTLG